MRLANNQSEDLTGQSTYLCVVHNVAVLDHQLVGGVQSRRAAGGAGRVLGRTEVCYFTGVQNTVCK